MFDYAQRLWENPAVTRYISVDGKFSLPQIRERLQQEIINQEKYNIQYWPIFTRNNFFIGCCGLRLRDVGNSSIAEIGIHLLPEYWGFGYASEAMTGVINFARNNNFQKLFAGHNPHNQVSRSLLLKLGFKYIGDEFYPPTGLNHPSYELLL